MEPIKFGTDGWRAVIGADFTYETLGRVAQAAGTLWAEEHPGGTIIVGYDTRFQAGAFARHAAEIIAGCGLRVILSDNYIPTPGLCWSVAQDDTAIGGVMLTASHNPSEYLGFKVRMADGGASPVEFTNRIEAVLPARATVTPGSVEVVDLVNPYLGNLIDSVDAEEIAQSVGGSMTVVIDPLFGAGQRYLSAIIRQLGIEVREIHGETNPGFGGLHPEPIPPWTDTARACVLANKASAAFVTDGDADRIGAIDEHGQFVSPHKIIALVAQHLVEDKGRSGRIIKTLSTSVTIDRLGKLLGCEVTTTPIGFKWIYEQMLLGDVLIGGEESGGIGIPSHVRERDGLLMALMLTEMMAYRKKTLGELVSELVALVGDMSYRRIDLKLEPAVKDAFVAGASVMNPSQVAGRAVRSIVREDGVKFMFDDDEWLLLRPSGTEPLVRVYSEANSPETLEELLAGGCALVKGE